MPEKPPNGRIVAQLRYASRLPGIVAGQDYRTEFYYDFWPDESKKNQEISSIRSINSKSMP
jgi:hypothetical protein